MAQQAVAYAYRYAAPSHLEGAADGTRILGLATWDGAGANPRLFRGRGGESGRLARGLLGPRRAL